ncbi:MAG: hypothetical protein ACI308_02305 [Muribaculaceae bacterium]
MKMVNVFKMSWVVLSPFGVCCISMRFVLRKESWALLRKERKGFVAEREQGFVVEREKGQRKTSPNLCGAWRGFE